MNLSSVLLDVRFQFCGSYYGGRDSKSGPPPRVKLTAEEERKLWREYKLRPTRLRREKIVRAYLCWAFQLAARYKGPRLEFDEAIGAANLGLMEAIERFDPRKGYRFATFSFFAIRRHLIEALAQTYPVRVSETQRKVFSEVASGQLPAGTPDSVVPRTLEEFFQRLGDTAQVTEIESMHERPADAPCVPGEADCPRDSAEQSSLCARVRALVGSLPELERELVTARHLRGRRETFEELGRRFHLHKSRVRETYDSAMLTLKKLLENNRHELGP